MQWHFSLRFSVRVLWPRPQHSRSQPSMPCDDTLQARSRVPKEPVSGLGSQKLGEPSSRSVGCLKKLYLTRSVSTQPRDSRCFSTTISEALSYLSFRRKSGCAHQHVFTSQLPDRPWHLQRRCMWSRMVWDLTRHVHCAPNGSRRRETLNVFLLKPLELQSGEKFLRTSGRQFAASPRSPLGGGDFKLHRPTLKAFRRGQFDTLKKNERLTRRMPNASHEHSVTPVSFCVCGGLEEVWRPRGAVDR
ncbi:hypothetical protein EYF80_005014 [Liparis tanakae]|uniref:Uncharacterized protein n=1 Tax=Liparis tanakae TaxID=230148 RepID=A0A4Z2J309_9TELE|nr:hypothetical protein EYF80_005014 [Liparis tanakae]